jgi:hypothetical protein
MEIFKKQPSDEQEVLRTNISLFSHLQPHFAGRLGSAM